MTKNYETSSCKSALGHIYYSVTSGSNLEMFGDRYKVMSIVVKVLVVSDLPIYAIHAVC